MSTKDSLFTFVLVKPTHYDDDGYPIQWFRSALPSNTLACMYSLAEDAQKRQALGPGIDFAIETYDETNRRVHPSRIIRDLKQRGGRALIGIVGVQSNQYPRSMDLARQFRAAGIQVCIGGFHVSGCIAMLPEMPAEMREAQALGIALFAGEAEEHRLDEVLRDAWRGELKPLYNFMDHLPSLEGEPAPILPRKHLARTTGHYSSIDLGRGCPYQCSFCTIINVQGRKSRFRTPDDLEQIIRENRAQGIDRFFITDDNFARNSDWEILLDRVIKLQDEGIRCGFTIQVDTLCHKIPEFHREGDEGGSAAHFHRAREHQSRQSDRGQEAAEQDHRVPRDAAEVARPRRAHLRRLHPRLPGRYEGIDPARRRDHQARAAARHPRVLLPDAATWARRTTRLC